MSQEPQRVEITIRVIVEVQQEKTPPVKPVAVEKPKPEPKTEIVPKAPPPVTPENHRAQNAAERILEYYLTYHPQARPGKPARDKIRARLREGYTEDQLKDAVDGNHRDPWHSGENERQKKYQSLDLIFRDSDHVQRFIELNEAEPPPAATEKSARTDRACEEFLLDFGELDAPTIGPRLLEAEEDE